ncbi:DNA replication/repair protein RecF [Saccharicrinis sp. FJH62]|uniref:DNA replication/repair protein RecF n=1 Tax=Saccharicrinis sp. FJH62 TaxID=3344657 RepID=UPI0035D41360
MFLERLSVVNFKNIEQADLDFCSKINCFIGDNGVGKTNLIDAIYYLSFCRSYFNASDSLSIKHEEGFFMLQGIYQRQGKEENISCGLKRKQKKQVKRNKKEYQKLSEHIGLLPVVMVSPADSRLISEGSDERRRYIDGVISQYDRHYLNALIQYNKVIQQRNALLKQLRESRSYDRSLIEILDQQLVHWGTLIYEVRKNFIDKLIPVFQNYHDIISIGRETVNIAYESNMHEPEYLKQLEGSFEKDLILGFTSLGIHKDDLVPYIDGYPIKKIGSQGQQKTFLISLKFAQFEFIRKVNNISPILLLDDIFDKLDSYRVEAIVKLVSGDTFGQIFITDTNRDHLVTILEKINEENVIYLVQSGWEISKTKSA